MQPEAEQASANTPVPPAAPMGPAPAADMAGRAAFAPRGGMLWWVSIAIVAFDQLTKFLITRTLGPFESHPLIPGLVDLVHVHNAGVAFGLLNDFEHPGRGLLTTALAIAALAGITYYARHIKPNETLARVGLSLILGGAVGNLLDRLRQSFVVDFVDVYWHDWHFWAFNVADAAITIGAILVFVELLLVNRHASDSV